MSWRGGGVYFIVYINKYGNGEGERRKDVNDDEGERMLM